MKAADVARAVKIGQRLAAGSGARLFAPLLSVVEHEAETGTYELGTGRAAALEGVAERAGIPAELLMAAVMVTGWPADDADIIEAAAALTRWTVDPEGVPGVLGDAVAVLRRGPVVAPLRLAAVGAFALMCARSMMAEVTA